MESKAPRCRLLVCAFSRASTAIPAGPAAIPAAASWSAARGDVIAGTAGATAGMKPQKVTGKVELVSMGKHAFSLTALHMQLIYVTSKTKFTGTTPGSRASAGNLSV